MISKELYSKIMNKIIDQHNNEEEISEPLQRFGFDFNFYINPLENSLVELLTNTMEDTDEWTSWYLYEKLSTGKLSTMECYDKDGWVMKSETPEDIYHIIIDKPILTGERKEE